MFSYFFFSSKVLVPKHSDFMGKMVEVEIIETGKHYMKGRPCEASKPVSPAISEPLPKGKVSGLIENAKDTLDSTQRNQLKEDLAKQERYIILSFVLLISALLVKLAWVCFKMLKDVSM